MKKLKPLLPSLKERQRYIVFEVITQSDCSFDSVSTAIWDSILSLHGTSGTADAGLQILPECYKNKKGILRVGHTFVDKARAGLACIQTIQSSPVIVRSLSTSGMINKLR